MIEKNKSNTDSLKIYTMADAENAIKELAESKIRINKRTAPLCK